mgnify:CR=1 FL=1
MARKKRVVYGAFNQGGVPTIACFNRATTPLGVDFDKLIAAMQRYVDEHVAPVWGTPAKLVMPWRSINVRIAAASKRGSTSTRPPLKRVGSVTWPRPTT